MRLRSELTSSHPLRKVALWPKPEEAGAALLVLELLLDSVRFSSSIMSMSWRRAAVLKLLRPLCEGGEKQEVRRGHRGSVWDDWLRMEKADCRVVVVGCGMSGVAAAQRLVKSGFPQVRILEATGRSGGRLLTKALGERQVGPTVRKPNRRSKTCFFENTNTDFSIRQLICGQVSVLQI